MAQTKVDVFDANERRIGGFKQKLLSVSGAFDVVDESDKQICALKGKWTGWNFSFMKGDQKLASL